MYTTKVIKHFKNPHNQGVIKNADAVGEAGNPTCGDVMKIYLKVKNNKIQEVKFETLGCAAAIAVSSALTDIVKGKTLEQALKITKDQIVKDLGGVPAPKIHCSMLGVEALHKAINEYIEKNSKKDKTEEKIIKVIEKIRPHLQADGGDLKFVSWDKKTGRVQVELVGMCACCPMSQVTLKEGVEKALKKEIKEVKEVVNS
jgi:nitrogen fixation NifU-like protein